MINLLWHSDDLKLGWNLGNVTNVCTSISERNLYFLYLIRTLLEPERTSFQNLQELWWYNLISKSYDQFTMAFWWFEVRLKFGKCDKCLYVNFRTKSILSILDSHIVRTGKDQLSESARTLMIAFNLEELWSIYYGTLMIWS